MKQILFLELEQVELLALVLRIAFIRHPYHYWELCSFSTQFGTNS